MSATTPYLSQNNTKLTLLAPTNNTFSHLAIDTSNKNLHFTIDSRHIGSSGLYPGNKLSPLASAILKRGLSSAYIQTSCLSSARSSRSRISLPKSSSFEKIKGPKKCQKKKGGNHAKEIFSGGLYKRVEEFLDSEDLYQIDVSEALYEKVKPSHRLTASIKRNNMLLVLEDGGVTEPELVKSACSSPKLLVSHIISSNLLQRRISKSQTPCKELMVVKESSGEDKKGFSKLDVKVRSPIMEKATPRSSRNSRGSLLNTPMSVKGCLGISPNIVADKISDLCKDGSPESLDKEGLGLNMGAVHGKIVKKSIFKQQQQMDGPLL